LNFSVV